MTYQKTRETTENRNIQIMKLDMGFKIIMLNILKKIKQNYFRRELGTIKKETKK